MTEEKSKFLFSIIVPVYNTEKYVEKTLKSIYEAMDRDCEVIVVNDGSKDNSEEIIKKFIKKLILVNKGKSKKTFESDFD